MNFPPDHTSGFIADNLLERAFRRDDEHLQCIDPVDIAQGQAGYDDLLGSGAEEHVRKVSSRAAYVSCEFIHHFAQRPIFPFAQGKLGEFEAIRIIGIGEDPGRGPWDGSYLRRNLRTGKGGSGEQEKERKQFHGIEWSLRVPAHARGHKEHDKRAKNPRGGTSIREPITFRCPAVRAHFHSRTRKFRHPRLRVHAKPLIPTMSKRVLIISTSAGTGHVRCAQALEKVFAADSRVAEVRHADALDYTNKLFRDFYSKLYMQLVRSAPDILGWAYRASDEPWKGEAARTQLDRLNTRPLVKLIKEFDPHITVCTHFMPAGIIAHLVEQGTLATHHSIVVTDFDCHAMWLSRLFHRYFVALDETKAHLEALGLPADRVNVTGIPIDPVFSQAIDREQVRRALRLDPTKTTLLLSGGALGVGPTEVVVRRLRDLKHDVQTIVICGKSEELRAKVEEAAGGEGTRFRVLGYTDKMHELMLASDIFIGKPGGLTTSEALACGLPMCIVSPIPGQEERNSDHLLEKGIAIKVNELTTLTFKLNQLLGDPVRLAGMRENALRWGRPCAARDVVRTLLEDSLPPLVLNKEAREAMTQTASGEAP
jgi:processive 1,2-diacylglycerol beta-glucosyltransferase